MSREIINQSRPDPKIYQVGQRVFARRAIKSKKSSNVVAKVKYAYTGPWTVQRRLDGSSYEIKHVQTGKLDKKHAAFLSPFPHQLLPLLPVDGPDNLYGQLNAQLQPDAYYDAGIQSFIPGNPYKESEETVLFSLPEPSLTFPTLSDINDEMCEWNDLELPPLRTEFETFESYVSTDNPTEPPKAAQQPTIPSAATLAAQILRCSDKLFFITHQIPGSSQTEWSLVRVAFEDSIRLQPSCLNTGKYLVKFYVCHPSDKLFDAPNQRYWLEYHPTFDGPGSDHKHTAHLIRPSLASKDYAIAEGLTPFRQWVRLSNSSTYICGPFDFADINGRRTKDRVPLAQWKILDSMKDRFSNPVPSLELLGYSVHFSQPHIEFTDSYLSDRFESCMSINMEKLH